MKAFLLSLVLLAGITAVAAVSLNLASRSSGEAFTQNSSVRL
jgi:formate hydrogenlyase subunit 4